MIYPLNGSPTTIIPEFTINTVDGADRYELQVAFDQGFFNIVSYSYWDFGAITSAGYPIHWVQGIPAPQQYLNNTVYYWRVRAMVNNRQDTSPWSTPWSYITTPAGSALPQPALISPPNNANVTWMNLPLTWGQIPIARWYQIQWSASSFFNDFTYRWTPGSSPTLGVSIKPQTTYYWRVLAYSDSSLSVFSQGRVFQTSNFTELTDAESDFDDGSSIYNYDNNLDVFWLIRPPGAQQINLSFSSFDTESGYDFVRVYDGETTTAPILGTFSGNSIPGTLTSSQGALLVRFTSDFLINGPGWQAHYEVTSSSPKVPIIIVPGIMGSPLYNDANNDSILTENERVWISTTLVPNPGQLVQLLLDEFGVNPPAGSGYVIKTSPLASYTQELGRKPLSYYGGIVEALQQQLGYVLHESDGVRAPNENLFIFTYDWRKDIRSSGLLFSRFIDSVKSWTQANRVMIIAHSMGGLVTKACIKDGQTSIDKVIFVATPHIGAPKAMYVGLTDKPFGFPWFVPELARQRVWWTLKEISRNFPTAYQLFPSERYCNLAPTNKLLQYYNGQNWNVYGFSGSINFFRTRIDPQTNNNEFNNGMITDALSFQNTFDTTGFGNLTVFNIAGQLLPTPGLIRINDEGVVPLLTASGDGTVPMESGQYTGASQPVPTMWAPLVEHSEMCLNSMVSQFVVNILRSSQLKSFVALDTLEGSPISGYQVTANGPVLLHAYDWFGRHTGPTSDSTFETNIPGSYYIGGWFTNDDETKIIHLPRLSGYKIVIQSPDSANFYDLDIDDINQSRDAAFLKYDSVAMLQVSKSYLTLDSVHAALILNVDRYGDSTVVTPILPDQFVVNPTTDYSSTQIAIPTNYRLYQNYPNPFNPNTTIEYALPRTSWVTLELFDLLGRRVATLVKERQEAGNKRFVFQNPRLASGVYFYRLDAGGFTSVKKLLLLK